MAFSKFIAWLVLVQPIWILAQTTTTSLSAGEVSTKEPLSSIVGSYITAPGCQPSILSDKCLSRTTQCIETIVKTVMVPTIPAFCLPFASVVPVANIAQANPGAGVPVVPKLASPSTNAMLVRQNTTLGIAFKTFVTNATIEAGLKPTASKLSFPTGIISSIAGGQTSAIAGSSSVSVPQPSTTRASSNTARAQTIELHTAIVGIMVASLALLLG